MDIPFCPHSSKGHKQNSILNHDGWWGDKETIINESFPSLLHKATLSYVCDVICHWF